VLLNPLTLLAVPLTRLTKPMKIIREIVLPIVLGLGAGATATASYCHPNKEVTAPVAGVKESVAHG